jgi:hypothetical protein
METNLKLFGGNVYCINNLGEIKNLVTGNKIKNVLNNGYYRVNLSYKGEKVTKYVHILLAQTFIPNPENKPEVNHINGLKHDNRLCNLEWVTVQENVIHAYANGLISKEKQRQMKNASSIVLDTYTGVFYLSIIELSKTLNITPDTFTNRHKNKRMNYNNKYLITIV